MTADSMIGAGMDSKMDSKMDNKIESEMSVIRRDTGGRREKVDSKVDSKTASRMDSKKRINQSAVSKSSPKAPAGPT